MYKYNDDAGCVIVFIVGLLLAILIVWGIDVWLSSPFEIVEQVVYKGYDSMFFIITLDETGGQHRLKVKYEQYNNLEVGQRVTLIGKLGKTGTRYETEIVE